jgi:hypothetical protein
LRAGWLAGRQAYLHHTQELLAVNGGVGVLEVQLHHHVLLRHRLTRTDQHLPVLALERLRWRQDQRRPLEESEESVWLQRTETAAQRRVVSEIKRQPRIDAAR